MKVSKRGQYALRALIDIGIAKEVGRPLVQIGDIAEKENLPIKFLEQILMQLKEAGYIESKRGKLGGYFLAMPAKRIKFGQVIRLIDGPLAPINCVSHTAYERCSCPNEEFCALHMLMDDVRNAIANILDRFTLADTVDAALKKLKRNKATLPFLEALLNRPSDVEVAATKAAHNKQLVAKVATAAKAAAVAKAAKSKVALARKQQATVKTAKVTVPLQSGAEILKAKRRTEL